MNTTIKALALTAILALGACTYTTKEDCPPGQWKEGGTGHFSGATFYSCKPDLPR